MFWKYNSLTSSQIDGLLDRAKATREAALLKRAAEEAAAAAAATSGQDSSHTAAAADSANEAEDTVSDVDSNPAETGSASVEEDSALSPVTLRDILDQEDVIQECKNQNKKLVEYLCQSDILSELISLIVEEPSSDLDDTLRFKLPHIAAEVLSCEVAQINEAISSSEILLGQLYSFMEQPSPLNPLLASFFTKAFGVLITRKSEQNWYSYQYSCVQVLEFLKKKKLVPDLLRHIGTSAISDLLLRLINCVDGNDIKQGLLDWLNDSRLIESMIGLLDPALPRDTHDNASRLLIEVLKVSRDGQFAPPNERCDDPLLATLEDPKTIELLLSVMFATPQQLQQQNCGNEEECCYSESSLVNGITVLMALLEVRRLPPVPSGAPNMMAGAGFSAATMFSGAENNGSAGETTTPEEAERQRALLDATVAAILPRVEDFTRLLRAPPRKCALRSSAGALDPPLGATRLSVAKLVVALLSTNNMEINRKFKELKTIDILLDLFFKYSLNNFLHSQVEQCVQLVFDWRPPPPPPASVLRRDSSSATQDGTNSKDGSSTSVACNNNDNNASSSTPPTLPSSPKNSEEEEDDDDKMETGEDKSKDDEPASECSTVKHDDSTSPSIAQQPFENPLLVHMFTQSRLIERILDSWDENESEERGQGQSNKAGKRKGYMGHLTRIATVVATHVEKSDAPCGPGDACSAFKLMKQLPESTVESWDKFIQGGLRETNARNVIIPASSYNTAVSSSDDDEFKSSQFPQESALQQMQQMSEHFIDSFSFGAEDLGESEDVPRNMKTLTTVDFGFDDDDDEAEVKDKAQAMFESVCDDKISGSDDEKDENEEDEDIWSDKTRQISFQDSSKKMEVDEEDDEWNNAKSAPVAMDTGNPWESSVANSRGAPEGEEGDESAPINSGGGANEDAPAASSTPPEDGWADFGAFGGGGGAAGKDAASDGAATSEGGVPKEIDA